MGEPKHQLIMSAITPPRNPESLSASIWAACDKLYKAGKGKIDRGLVLAACPEYDKGTVSTQYQRWRVYNGLATVRGPRKEGSAKPGPKPGTPRTVAGKKPTAKKKAPKAKKKATAKKRAPRKAKAA